VQDELEKLRRRMYDISGFMKTLKQRYSMSYNGRHDRDGTLWCSRFRSVLVEGRPNALSTMAAYIDLNAVRAGLVDDPKDYRFCGYAEAVAGDRRSLAGLAAVLDNSFDGPVSGDVLARYRVHLYVSGEAETPAYGGSSTRLGFSREAVDKVLAENGKLSRATLIHCHVRYMTDGLALGGREFLDELLQKFPDVFGRKRRTVARAIPGCDRNFQSARALRKEPIVVPDYA